MNGFEVLHDNFTDTDTFGNSPEVERRKSVSKGVSTVSERAAAVPRAPFAVYERLCATHSATWGVADVTVDPHAPADLQADVRRWRQWLVAIRRLHVLLSKGLLLADEADEVEQLAAKLNVRLQRQRFDLNDPEAGWKVISETPTAAADAKRTQ